MNQYQVQEVEQFEPTEGKCYFIIEMGKSCILRKQISDHLQKQRPNLKEVHSVDDCNVILVFCPIVSRAGTDIDAALNKLNACSASKPAIFMVFHLTFDPDKIVPDSSRCINRRNTLTVDCLFSEDGGLLTCDMNTEALTKIIQCFKYQIEWTPLGGAGKIKQCCAESCLDILLMSISCLCRDCCQILGIMKAEICNCIRRIGRGMCESSTDDERSGLINEDEGINV